MTVDVYITVVGVLLAGALALEGNAQGRGAAAGALYITVIALTLWRFVA